MGISKADLSHRIELSLENAAGSVSINDIVDKIRNYLISMLGEYSLFSKNERGKFTMLSNMLLTFKTETVSVLLQNYPRVCDIKHLGRKVGPVNGKVLEQIITVLTGTTIEEVSKE